MSIYLSRATLLDSDLVLKWTNEESTRERAFDKRKVSPEEHGIWYRNMITSKDVIFLIARNERNTPVGCIRVNRQGIVSLCVSEQFRGRKYASKIITQALKYLTTTPNHLELTQVSAFILEDNIPSIKSFKRVGFLNNGIVRFRNHDCLHFLYKLDFKKGGLFQ